MSNIGKWSPVIVKFVNDEHFLPFCGVLISPPWEIKSCPHNNNFHYCGYKSKDRDIYVLVIFFFSMRFLRILKLNCWTINIAPTYRFTCTRNMYIKVEHKGELCSTSCKIVSHSTYLISYPVKMSTSKYSLYMKMKLNSTHKLLKYCAQLKYTCTTVCKVEDKTSTSLSRYLHINSTDIGWTIFSPSFGKEVLTIIIFFMFITVSWLNDNRLYWK